MRVPGGREVRRGMERAVERRARRGSSRALVPAPFPPRLVAFAFHPRAAWLLWAAWLVVASMAALRAGEEDEDLEFFEKRVRPALIEHCYACHSAEARELKGALRLDLKSGWELGGESGEPAIVPGKPEQSPLIRAVRHEADVAAMPPNRAKLPPGVITDLTTWVKRGAADPRLGKVESIDPSAAWETTFQRRLGWWSLRPVARPTPPAVRQADWVRDDVDGFILARLEQASLRPAAEADRRALARRLSFALTGLPPDPAVVERFAADAAPRAYDDLVEAYLASPHFGERWARHWMDVVHYADTHGYEWDVPAKNAWRYRDYLARAFNADLPYDRFVLEQIAGDLLEPRVDPASGVNESLIGPMMLRLGERRHGDNAQVEGVAQEAVANMIDTLGKAFLGTTLACAQCHDHKLDAVEQRDYYALAGMLMSTRYSARSIDAVDPNLAVLDQLRSLKSDLRRELARLWLAAADPDQPRGAADKLRSTPADAQPTDAFPASLAEFWKRSLGSAVTAEQFARERAQRVDANRRHLTLLADFTREDGAGGWRWEGMGTRHGLVRDGDMVIRDSGDAVVQHLLPAGRFSHVFSRRLAGALRSPALDAADPSRPLTFSIEMAAGNFASESFIVDRALHPERMAFPARPDLGWRTLTAGNFDSLEGTVDRAPRQVYFELATKALNNYFPPRVGYGGVSEAEVADERSWFGATRVFQHAPGQGPRDELARFAPLFDELAPEADWARRLAALLGRAARRWGDDQATADDVRLLNEGLALKLLPNELSASNEVARLAAEYRRLEQRLRPDRTVGSAADWSEGRDARVGARGSYTELGDVAPRGVTRFLNALVPAEPPADERASGRLRWAQQVVDPRNPLTARVHVNRVWHYLFGEGLSRAPDDFGHLGERPSHPELLDHLAARFMEEGWSTKKLIRRLVGAAAWRQASVADPRAVAIDPENRLWHHRPPRRLEAEAIRDALLAVSGRLDPALGGPPIEPHRAAEDARKRLLRGPLDGLGRRSLYIEMTLMEPPRFLALFNQPLPKQTVGRRDVTTVPDQALALLNDPFVIDQARCWSERLVGDDSAVVEQRVARMLAAALGRPARDEEVDRLAALARRGAELRGLGGDLMKQPRVWQDAAHAVFNLKEFIHVP